LIGIEALLRCISDGWVTRG